jgi:hypothetical protein
MRRIERIGTRVAWAFGRFLLFWAILVRPTVDFIVVTVLDKVVGLPVETTNEIAEGVSTGILLLGVIDGILILSTGLGIDRLWRKPAEDESDER